MRLDRVYTVQVADVVRLPLGAVILSVRADGTMTFAVPVVR